MLRDEPEATTAPVTPARTTLLAGAALLIVTAVWGSTFVLIKDLVQTLPVTDFLAVRFVIAAAAMVAVLGRHVLRLSRDRIVQGVVLGGIYGTAQVLQTAGLARTPAAVSGFITGTYVVLTPIIAALLLRQRTPRSVWAAVALATAGLAVLSLRGLSVGPGEALVLASAACYAGHIVGLGRWSGPGEALGLATVQMVAVAVLCSLAAVPHGITLPSSTGEWAGTLYTALAAGGLAMILQTWAQGHLSATRAAVIMTAEPAFAALFAVLVGSERLTWRMLLGGVLVVAAMYLVELSGLRASRRRGTPAPGSADGSTEGHRPTRSAWPAAPR